MSYSDINGVLTDDSKTSIRTNIESIKALMPFSASLTTIERQKLRKLGPKRLSYTTETNRASNDHTESLAASFKINEYNNKVKLHSDLLEVQAWVATVQDILNNTLMALGANIMKQSDSAYAYLKVAAEKSDDQGLNTAVSRIAELLKQAKKEEEEEQKNA